MWSLLVSFAITGLSMDLDNALVASPFDLIDGKQIIELRRPLVNRSNGARLILFTRETTVNTNGTRLLSEFEERYPIDSLRATIADKDGASRTLNHSGYDYYNGAFGLVLTFENVDADPQLFTSLDIASNVSMRDVKAVWLDRGAKNIRDVAPNF